MRYLVRLPVTACIAIEVDADNEEKAIEIAFNSDIELSIVDPSGLVQPEIEEWQVHKHVLEGNVYNGVIDEIEVNEFW